MELIPWNISSSSFNAVLLCSVSSLELPSVIWSGWSSNVEEFKCSLPKITVPASKIALTLTFLVGFSGEIQSTSVLAGFSSLEPPVQ